MDTFSKRFSLEGKVALVTGAAYGIGFAIAEAYAMAGAKIAFNCRGQHHLDQARADYKAKGIDAKGYICDVTNEEDVKKMVADIESNLGTIDILVNNAGIIKRIPMTEMSVEEFRHVIDIVLAISPHRRQPHSANCRQTAAGIRSTDLSYQRLLPQDGELPMTSWVRPCSSPQMRQTLSTDISCMLTEVFWHISASNPKINKIIH